MENLGFKGVLDFLDEDSALMKKYTVEEFLSNDIAPDNSDMTVDEAYSGFCDFIEERKKANGKRVV